MTRAPAPARIVISSVVPTATIRPSPTAMACATVLRSSTVKTLPLTNARSTRGCALAAAAMATATAAQNTRVSMRRRRTPASFAEARPRTDLDFTRRVPQLAELHAHAGRDRAGLLLRLEAREVRPLAPRERPAQ